MAKDYDFNQLLNKNLYVNVNILASIILLTLKEIPFWFSCGDRHVLTTSVSLKLSNIDWYKSSELWNFVSQTNADDSGINLH